MGNKIFLMLLISALFLNCFKNEQQNNSIVTQCDKQGIWEKEGKNVRFEEVLEINPENYDSVFLSRIGIIRSDDNGNIFIADKKEAKIYKFDSQGNYITKFVRNGQGPGETNFILDFIIKNNDLYIFNTQNNNILQYNTDGNFIKNIKLDIDTRIFATNLNIIENNFLLFGRFEQDSSMFHVFDKTGHYLKSFGKYQIIDSKYSKNELDFFQYNGNTAIKNDILFYTNDAYDNKLYVYQDGVMKNILETQNFIDKQVYLLREFSEYPENCSMNFQISMGNQDGSYIGINYVKSSENLSVTSDGTLFNIYSIMNNPKDIEDGKNLYLELINAENKYLGSYKIDDRYWYFSSIDNNDFVYAHKHENEQWTYVKLKMVFDNK